jgi:FkbM family methyltransferase
MSLAGMVRKLGQVARSDLGNRDKLRYVLKTGAQCAGSLTYRLRGGVNGAVTTIMLRQGTTDFRVFDEIFVEKVYGPCLAALPDGLGPVSVIDLGANIGLSAVYFSRVLEIGEIIAVEPDPDNFRMLSENLRRAGLANRTTAVRAFAGADRGFAELHDSGNGAWGMRMGAVSETGTPVVPLAAIAGLAKTGAPMVLKCDIEGAERQLFLRIRDWGHLIRYIVLELHAEFLPVEELLACLASSGFEWTIHGTPPAGASIAVLLLERGERRKLA